MLSFMNKLNEIAVEENELDDFTKNVLFSMDAIKNNLMAYGIITKENNIPKESTDGEIECPICKTGKLFYSIASLNGHIHGKCNTPNCVNLMQ